MNRYVLTVELKDDPAAIATYTEYHQRVWPEVLASLRAAGIRDMEIFRLDRRLVMIVETDGTEIRHSFARHHGSHPRVIEWETLMTSLQVPPGWTVMTSVFRMDAADTATAERAER
jgi:L-rhamnose mutarotase